MYVLSNSIKMIKNTKDFANCSEIYYYLGKYYKQGSVDLF